MRRWCFLFFCILASQGWAASEGAVSVLDQPPFIYAVSPYDMMAMWAQDPLLQALGLDAKLKPEPDRYSVYLLGREVSDKPYGLSGRIVLPGTMSLEQFNLTLDTSPVRDNPARRERLEPLFNILEGYLEIEALERMHGVNAELDPKVKEEFFGLLRGVLGPVTTYFLRSNASLLSRDQLEQLAALPGKEPLPVLRRFGFTRNRIALPTLDSRPDKVQLSVHRGERDTLLIDSAHAHFPGFVPIPVFEEFESAVGFGDEMNSKELRHMWRKLSNNMHQLSFSLLRRDIERRQRRGMPPRLAITPYLLEVLEEESSRLDLARAFFFVIEDYLSEKMLATMALIDGSHRLGEEPYDLPIVRRLKDLSQGTFDLAREFAGPVFEMHSLAIDPEGQPKVSLDELFLIVAQHIEDAGFEDVTFLGQTDKLGARKYAKYGFVEHSEATKIIGEDEVVLTVKGRAFIDAVRKLMPPLGVVRASLPNRITKRLAGVDNDAFCEAQANGRLNIDDALFEARVKEQSGGS